MARRQSQELGLANGPADQSIAQFQGGGYRPQATPVTPSPGENALAGLLALGESASSQLFEQSAEEAYLKGGIAAAQGQSQENIATDPFMAPFADGGYNDENYRIVQTKETQSFKQWLEKEGHQYAPTDPRVTEALNKASGNTMAAITPGMTRRARAEALMSQNKTNETLVTQHNKAYKEWSVAEAARRIRPQGNQIIATLSNAMTSNDSATYTAATDKAALYFAEISNNPDLPKEMRDEIGSNFITAMLNNDQRLPVEEMRQAGILDNLPFETREKIDTELRESKNRTAVRDLSGQIAEAALFEQGLKDGKYSTTQGEAYIQRMYKLAPQYMTLPKAISLLDGMNKGTANKPRTQDVINALLRRDKTTLYAMDVDTPQAMDLLDQQLRLNRVPDHERLGTLVGVGLDLGHIAKGTVESVDQAVRAIGAAKSDQPVHPDFVNTLNLVTSMVQVGSQTAPYKTTVLLESMSDDTRGAMSYVFEQAQYGVKPDAALRNYWARNEEIKNLPDAARQRRTKEWRKKYSGAINKEFPRSYFKTLMSGLVSDTQLIDDSPTTDSMILSNVWSEMRFQENNPNNLGLTEDSLVSAATAAVRSRVIPVTAGDSTDAATPLILDRGVDILSTFGTTDRKLIGQVLANTYPNAKEDLKSIFVWDKTEKRIVNRQVDELGNSVGDTVVDLTKVKGIINQNQVAKDTALSKTNFGDLRQVGDSLLAIDGRNSAGVTPGVAYGMRDLLLKADPTLSAELAGLQPGTIAELPAPTSQEEREVSMALQLNNTNKPSSAQFRDVTDLALSRATRHIAPQYIHVKAQAAIAAAVITEGPAVTEEVVKAATKALDNNDPEAFTRALDKVTNATLRNELRQALPIGRSETGTSVPFSAGFSAY